MFEVEVEAGTIQYEDTGGPGAVVVLLHGLLMDHTQWDSVVPALQSTYRCIRPVLPLGSHRVPMRADADLSLLGMVNIVADFLDALRLEHVTLVVSDWGGGMLLTHAGRDQRVARLVICPCEAFDNFPPRPAGHDRRRSSTDSRRNQHGVASTSRRVVAPDSSAARLDGEASA